jgi:hypothetical protein
VTRSLVRARPLHIPPTDSPELTTVLAASLVLIAAVAVGVTTGRRGFQSVRLDSSSLDVHGTWRQEPAEDECPGDATCQGAEDGADRPHPPSPTAVLAEAFATFILAIVVFAAVETPLRLLLGWPRVILDAAS